MYSTDSEHKLDAPEETQAFVEFFRDADLVIFDAQYSLAEAVSVKEDWGHSSNIVGVELAQMARVRHLCLFHHEPVLEDEQIAAVLRETRRLEEITRGDAPGRDLGGVRRDGNHALSLWWEKLARAGRGRARGIRRSLPSSWGWCSPPSWVPVRALRLAAFDAYQVLAPRQRRSAPVVIVEVDDASLARLGQWPWPRTRLAQLVAAIARGRPAALGYRHRHARARSPLARRASPS